MFDPLCLSGLYASSKQQQFKGGDLKCKKNIWRLFITHSRIWAWTKNSNSGISWRLEIQLPGLIFTPGCSHPLVQISSIHCLSQAIRDRELEKKTPNCLLWLTRHIGHKRTLLGTFEKSIQHKKQLLLLKQKNPAYRQHSVLSYVCDQGVLILYHQSEQIPWVVSIP